MKISIVTVVKDGCQFIGRTIESVLDQDYKNIEYFIIDGGSTDGTINIIKSYNSKITKWISEEDNGIADAFNKGLGLSSGDYILFLNADDMLADRYVLSSMVQDIMKNDYPMLIYGDCDIADRKTGKVLYRECAEFPLNAFKKGRMIPQPGLLVHRNYFDRYGCFDTRFKCAMDFDLILRGVFTESIVHTRKLITVIRTGGVSVRDRNLVVNEIIEALKKYGFIKTNTAEQNMRYYFAMRSYARSLLNKVHLYGLFFYLRNKLRNC